MLIRLCSTLFLVTSILTTAQAQFVQPDLCDMRCHCTAGESVVDCNRQDRLQGVPTNIPRGVNKLYIQDGDFPSPSILTRANMTGLEQLEHLSIIYCNLQAIAPRTFLGMSKLKHLDLSRNALIQLEAYTFLGLQLVNLYLQEQRSLPDSGLKIAKEAFHGLTADQINLRGNLISSMHYNLFSEVNGLDRLILSDNRITVIDEGFAKHFDHTTRLLDLTGNPLECSCKLAWIAMRSTDWSSSLPGLNMTCIYYHTPHRSRDRSSDFSILEIHRLTADQLCPTSRIQHIDVNVFDGADRVILDCTAVAIPRRPSSAHTESGGPPVPSLLSHAPPGVAWRYIEGGHLREVRRLPSEDALRSDFSLFGNSSVEGVSSTVRLNVSLSTEARKYTCTTWDDIREAEEVIVTVRGPPKTVKVNNGVVLPSAVENPKDNTDTENDKKRSNSAVQQADVAYDPPHYLLQPQFSLIQMALAVGGTFLATLILLFIGARCLRGCQHHSLFRISPSLNSMNESSAAKGAYLGGKVLRGDNTLLDTRPKSNGLISIPTENGQFFMQQTPNQPYSQMMLTGTLSPRLAPIPTLNGQYLPQNLITSPQSSTGTEELQANLALLTSTPLLPQNQLRPIFSSDGTLSPCLTTMRPNQGQLAYWSKPPGSHYSVASSHEYDVPKVFDLPSCGFATTNSVSQPGMAVGCLEQNKRPDFVSANPTNVCGVGQM